MREPRPPVTTDRLSELSAEQRAAARAAATDPLAVGLGVAVVVAAIVLSAAWLVAVAVAAYLALVVLTYLEQAPGAAGPPAPAPRGGPTTAPVDVAAAPAGSLAGILRAAERERRLLVATPSPPEMRKQIDALVLGMRRAAAGVQRLDTRVARERAALEALIDQANRSGGRQEADTLRARRARLERREAAAGTAAGQIEDVTIALRAVRARLADPAATPPGTTGGPSPAGELHALRRRVDALVADLGG